MEPAAGSRSSEEMSQSLRWSLAGKTALVTGGTKGIGHAIVEELAGLGVRVHTCSRTAADLHDCRRRWQQAKGLHSVTASVCDVSVSRDREGLVATVRDLFDGRLDILVNNAGQSLYKAAADTTPEDYSRLMATNLDPCFHLAQLAHPLLRNGNASVVVHVSSIAGFIAYPALSVYSLTKGAMHQLTRSLAAEWAPHGIRVNCVAPGGIHNTDISSTTLGDPARARRLAEMEMSRVPMRRFGKPHEVAASPPDAAAVPLRARAPTAPPLPRPLASTASPWPPRLPSGTPASRRPRPLLRPQPPLSSRRIRRSVASPASPTAGASACVSRR